MNEETFQDLITEIEKALPEGIPGLAELQKKKGLHYQVFWPIVNVLLVWYLEKLKPHVQNATIYAACQWYLSLSAKIELIIKDPKEGDSLNN